LKGHHHIRHMGLFKLFISNMVLCKTLYNDGDSEIRQRAVQGKHGGKML